MDHSQPSWTQKSLWIPSNTEYPVKSQVLVFFGFIPTSSCRTPYIHHSFTLITLLKERVLVWVFLALKNGETLLQRQLMFFQRLPGATLLTSRNMDHVPAPLPMVRARAEEHGEEQ